MEIFIAIIAICVLVLSIVCQWRIFVKAGRKGWECLIPIWGQVMFFSIAKVHWLWLYAIGLFSLMGEFGHPLYSIIASLIIFYTMYSLARAFGKSIGSSIILSILPSIILYLIVAFDKSKYDFDEE